jgi:hypothetical protein
MGAHSEAGKSHRSITFATVVLSHCRGPQIVTTGLLKKVALGSYSTQRELFLLGGVGEVVVDALGDDVLGGFAEVGMEELGKL